MHKIHFLSEKILLTTKYREDLFFFTLVSHYVQVVSGFKSQEEFN